MKRFKLLAIFSILSISLNAQRKVIAFKKSYVIFPYQINTTKSYDEVWSDMIYFLVKNNMAGKILDKSTGMIVAQLTNASLTHEDKNGDIDTSCWALVERIYDVPTNKYYYADNGTIEWNISVKHDSGKVNVSIDSMKVFATTTIHGFNYFVGFETKDDYKTHFEDTGRLEKMLELKLE